MSGKQFQPLVPGRSTSGAAPSFAGQSRIVAFADTVDGAAAIALLIFCAFVMAPDFIPFIVMSWPAGFVTCESANRDAVRQPATPIPATANITVRADIVKPTCRPLRIETRFGYIDNLVTTCARVS